MQLTQNDLIKFLSTGNYSLDTFIKFLNGSFFEIDNPKTIRKEVLNQCFDLFYAYCIFLGIDYKLVRMDLARYLYEQYNSNKTIQKNFKKIQNTLDFAVKVGDVVIWNNTYGPSGHVAIAVKDGTISEFTCLSQNDPTGSVCKIKNYKYINNYGKIVVYGVLRPKTHILKPEDIPLYEKSTIENRGGKLFGFKL